MGTTFYLVRHALKEKGIGDVDISSLGIEQAQRTARHFSNNAIRKLVCSPLNRAKQTAQWIAKETGAELREDSRLRERANWGDLPGQAFEEFVAMWERCTKERDYSPSVGDSASKAGERFASCLLELSDNDTKGAPIIVITHGGVLTDFLVNEIPVEELCKWHPDFLVRQSQLVPECSITTVSCEDGQFRLVDFANVTHLV